MPCKIYIEGRIPVNCLVRNSGNEWKSLGMSGISPKLRMEVKLLLSLFGPFSKNDHPVFLFLEFLWDRFLSFFTLWGLLMFDLWLAEWSECGFSVVSGSLSWDTWVSLRFKSEFPKVSGVTDWRPVTGISSSLFALEVTISSSKLPWGTVSSSGLDLLEDFPCFCGPCRPFRWDLKEVVVSMIYCQYQLRKPSDYMLISKSLKRA